MIVNMGVNMSVCKHVYESTMCVRVHITCVRECVNMSVKLCKNEYKDERKHA